MPAEDGAADRGLQRDDATGLATKSTRHSPTNRTPAGVAWQCGPAFRTAGSRLQNVQTLTGSIVQILLHLLLERRHVTWNTGRTRHVTVESMLLRLCAPN